MRRQRPSPKSPPCADPAEGSTPRIPSNSCAHGPGHFTRRIERRRERAGAPCRRGREAGCRKDAGRARYVQYPALGLRAVGSDIDDAGLREDRDGLLGSPKRRTTKPSLVARHGCTRIQRADRRPGVCASCCGIRPRSVRQVAYGGLACSTFETAAHPTRAEVPVGWQVGSTTARCRAARARSQDWSLKPGARGFARLLRSPGQHARDSRRDGCMLSRKDSRSMHTTPFAPSASHAARRRWERRRAVGRRGQTGFAAWVREDTVPYRTLRALDDERCPGAGAPGARSGAGRCRCRRGRRLRACGGHAEIPLYPPAGASVGLDTGI